MNTLYPTEIRCRICGRKEPAALLEELKIADGWTVEDHLLMAEPDYFCGDCQSEIDKYYRKQKRER